MIKVVSVDNIKKSDKLTIESGVSGIELMSRAAKGICEAVKWRGKIAIVCGGGNNGGDGYALALILKNNGHDCEVFQVSTKLTPDSQYYYNQCLLNSIKVHPFTEDLSFEDYDMVADCILGTGFKGKMRGLAAVAAEKINGAKYVVAADINSGLDGDSGRAEIAVKSDITVSIGYYKPGHFLNDAKDYIGKLKNADIGIKLCDKPYYLMEEKDFAPIFSQRKQNTHKGSFGKAALMGGSLNYSGAVKLANLSLSALKAGCGLCSLIVPRCIAASVMPYILESTLFAMPCDGNNMLFDKQALEKALQGVKALGLGMGWGESPRHEKILEFVLSSYDIPIVIDADGINALAKSDLRAFRAKKAKVIITPHIKEFSRISRKTIEEININPIEAAKDFALEHDIIVLLKGASTIITDGKDVYITNTGNAGMAKGGSGDVLSGIITGINAFGGDNLLLNAAAGAFINGRAGDYAVKSKNQFSLTPSDTVSYIYKAINDIINQGEN